MKIKNMNRTIMIKDIKISRVLNKIIRNREKKQKVKQLVMKDILVIIIR